MGKITVLGYRRIHSALRHGLTASLLAIFSTAPLLGVLPIKAAAATLPGPYATILFSRTEITSADNCVQNDTNTARLDTEVAPYLKSKGMVATGTLTPNRIYQSTYKCTHYNDSMMGSWDNATNFAQNYGWTFVSHTASYPANLPSITGAQADAETCGSANTITNHGLPGANGYIAYPGAEGDATALQTDFGSKCFAWGRQYGSKGVTKSTLTAPYWQHTTAGNGGPCADTTQPCSQIKMQNGSTKYSPPSTLISTINNLKAGDWFTFQSFLLVKGKNPPTPSGNVQWDCTSSNPNLHWTNDNERYCYNDFQTVIEAIKSKGLTVTDPLSVGVAFGRPATYPKSALSTPDTTPPTAPTNLTATTNTSDTHVDLSWTAATDNVGVTGYQIERSTDQSTWSLLSGNTTSTSYNDATSAAATHYYYRVRALDVAGNTSDYATTDVLTPDAPPPDTIPPAAPGDFQASPVSSGSDVNLSWTAATDNVGVSSYRLERSEDQTSWQDISASIQGNSYHDATTGFNKTYYYRLRAFDAAGNQSDPVVATVTTSIQLPLATEYVDNPSIESGSISGWMPYSSKSAVSAVKPAGGAKDGQYALMASNKTSTSSAAGLMDKTPHWVSNTKTGTAYTGSMWLSGTAGRTVTVQIRECNATGTSCPGVSNVNVQLPSSGWVQAKVGYTARGNDNQLRFSAYGTLPAGASFLADAFSLTSPAL
jgi:hypothetical protein